MAKLGDIATIQSGGTPARSIAEYWEDGTIPWVKISDIKSKHLNQTEEMITEAGLENSSAKIFPKGTILYTIFATLGETSILDINAATNQAIAGISITDSRVLPDYLYYYLLSQKIHVQKIGRGVAQNNINMKLLRDFDVPLPSKEAQLNIIEQLNRVTELLFLRKQQLTKLDELIKARFVEMFGDPYTNSKDYPLKKGESFFKLSNGKAVPESKRLNGGIPAYGGNGISWYTDESLFDADTIVVGRVGFQSGNVHLVKGPLWVTDNAMYMSSCDFSQYNLTFLIELMAHVDFTKFQDAGDLKKITQKPFMQFEYLCPPLSLQNQFSAFVAEVDKSKVEVQKALDQTQLLFDSLMQQYFG